MIDNYEETMALIKKMEAHLPIPAHPIGKEIRKYQNDRINKLALKKHSP
jgi:hypothetical protein